jgi:hypothetical protein
MPETIGEHISALIATITLVFVLGIVGELELRDIEHVQQQQKEQGIVGELELRDIEHVQQQQKEQRQR